jgi:hypothetical protein
MKSKLFTMFGTDKNAEKTGVWINYGDVKFLVARAGGSNIEYAERLKAKIRPLRNQIERDTLPKAEDDRITAEVYAETVIKDVQVLTSEGSWERGLPTEDGKVVPLTREGLVALLLELPDLFRDLRVQANDAVKFTKEQETADAKN